MIIKFIKIIIFLFSLLVFLWPLTRPGLIAGHDTGARFVHVQMMAKALKDGQFPVRWVEGPTKGLSHPLFNYYPPLFYYPPAILILLGVGLVPAVYTTLALSAIIGWLGMYLFVKKLAGSLPAVISASIFIFTPYRISQIYVRAAYGEFLATALIPWAFLGIYNLYNDYNRYNYYKNFLLLSFSLAAILTSHQPTFIMILPALLAWIGYLWIIRASRKEMLISFLAIGVALLLAASFVIPLIGESQFIRPVGLSAGYFDFRQHFATIGQLIYSPWGYGVSQPGPNDGMSFQVGVLNWVVVAGAVGLLLYNLYKNYNRYNYYIFFLSLFLFSLFMSTSASLPIWERFSILSYIQYPWRYLAVSVLATSVLAGLVFYNLYNRYNHYKNYILLLFLFLPILFNLKYLAPAAYLSRDIFNFGSKNFPRTDALNGLEPSYFPARVSQINSDPSIPRFRLVQGKAKIKSLTDKITFQEFSAQVTSPATIRINTHYFPGWQARIDNGKEVSLVTPGFNNPEGNMEITLTPGNYKVSLQFTNTPIRRLANYLSLGTALGLLILAIFPMPIQPRRLDEAKL